MSKKTGITRGGVDGAVIIVMKSLDSRQLLGDPRPTDGL